ncbi:MAG TPA: hypothetical protein VIS99_03330 [Terrimicrobiaceae bacterium]
MQSTIEADRCSADSPAGHCAYDQEGLCAGDHSVWQPGLRRLQRKVFLAREEPNEWPPLQTSMFAKGSAEDRIALLKRIEDRTHSDWALDFEMYLIADTRQISQVIRKDNSDHRSV